MIATLLFSILVNVQPSHPLYPFQWKKRILIIDGPESMSIPAVRAFIEKDKEVRDRDMLILFWRENEMSTFPETPSIASKGKLIRKHYQLTGECRFILIGKDGGIKLDQPSSSSSEDIFDLIDSMPMRQAEMRRKGE